MMNQAHQLSALACLQSRYAIMDLTGKLFMIDMQQISNYMTDKTVSNISYYEKSAAEITMRRHLEQLPVACQSPASEVKNFWISPYTRVFNESAFTPLTVTNNVLNLWLPPIAGKRGADWSVIGDFLHDIICDGDESRHRYLINFLAHMLQKPEEKPGVILVLMGGQGIGKGMFFKLLRAIWSKSALQVNSLDQVVGRFNAILEKTFIVMMDEALFSSDRPAIDKMKSLISEDYIVVEQKQIPSRRIASLHRFFAATNHMHFASIDADDRRHIFFNVSHKRQQDTIYFSKLNAAIADNNIISAFVDHLLNQQLKTFDVRQKPASTTQTEQKLLSLRGFERFWYELLHRASISSSMEPRVSLSDEESFVSTDDLIECFKSFDKGAERHATTQATYILKLLVKMCPSAKRHRQKNKRGVTLPAITIAREAFESFIGGAINWDE